jgi:hypothetical protein
MKKKILAIQPHSDDVLFSAAHVLLNEGYEVQVLCVESDPKRVPEDRRLYEFLGIPYHNLGIEFVDNSYYEFFKRYKSCRLEDAVPYLEEYFGEELLTQIRERLVKWITRFMKQNPDYRILAPLGIGHPFHLYVHEVIRVSPFSAMYYREFPHSYKRRNKEQIAEVQGRMTLTHSVPVEPFADVKWQLASKFYRTQSGLLFYEQGYIKKNLPEEVYEE